MNEALKPVRTREDCFSWLNLRDIDIEVFAAVTGAQKYFRERQIEEELIPETVLCKDDGTPYIDRSAFLETVVMFIAWRLWALGERNGVGVESGDIGLPSNIDPQTAMQALKTSHYAPWVGGKVRTITDAEFKTLPKDMQRAMRAAAKSGKTVKVKS
ncbi:MAG: hypothetical protein V4646_13980 [Pseudomonadota bacterium]